MLKWMWPSAGNAALSNRRFGSSMSTGGSSVLESPTDLSLGGHQLWSGLGVGQNQQYNLNGSAAGGESPLEPWGMGDYNALGGLGRSSGGGGGTGSAASSPRSLIGKEFALPSVPLLPQSIPQPPRAPQLKVSSVAASSSGAGAGVASSLSAAAQHQQQQHPTTTSSGRGGSSGSSSHHPRNSHHHHSHTTTTNSNNTSSSAAAAAAAAVADAVSHRPVLAGAVGTSRRAVDFKNPTMLVDFLTGRPFHAPVGNGCGEEG